MVELEQALKELNAPKQRDKVPFATVVEVSDKGVKIRLDGEEEAREIYYDSYVYVDIGDRVRLDHVSDTTIVAGKLLYYRKGERHET